MDKRSGDVSWSSYGAVMGTLFRRDAGVVDGRGGAMKRLVVVCLVVALSWACGDDASEDGDEYSGLPEEAELGLGEVDDLKEDGGWGAALTCKAIPDLPALVNPEVVISLDGLTLHLTDESTGFGKVFPIGPGKIQKALSLTPTSLARPGQVFYMRMDHPTGAETADSRKEVWAMNYSCRIWWLDPDTRKKVPVFAGLPFIRLEGAPTLGYAIHGPIDSYTLPSGGLLRRGYVSHGCIRMEASDVLELFARTRGRKVPVRIQQSVERRVDGSAVDLEQRWLLSECTQDSDCNYTGGLCRQNSYAGRGFCTAACTKFCSYDKFGYPQSFCVADPEDDTKGVCTLKSSDLNHYCRRYPGLDLYAREPRFSQPSVLSDVCLPGSSGWIGSACFSDLDCNLIAGETCELASAEGNRPGYCTLACTKFCPDMAGYPGTFCVGGQSGGECVQKCSIADDCPFNYQCEPDIPRYNQPSVRASVCL
jgi:hypothetical protein